jgi:hypothetical protein
VKRHVMIFQGLLLTLPSLLMLGMDVTMHDDKWLPDDILMQVFIAKNNGKLAVLRDKRISRATHRLKKHIKIFMTFRACCKQFYRMLTPEVIGSFCKSYHLTEKNSVLKNILTIEDKKSMTLPLRILLCAHADCNLVLKKYDLEKEVKENNIEFFKELFSIMPSVPQDITALTFSIKTIEMAQLFIDNKVNIHKKINGKNILHGMINPDYSLELMQFYIEKCNVDIMNVDPSTGFTIIHTMTHALSNNGSGIDNFLGKASFILAIQPSLINSIDNKGRTVYDLVQTKLAGLKKRKKEIPTVYKEDSIQTLEKLSNFFKEHDALTGEEVAKSIYVKKHKKDLCIIS